MAQTPAMRSIQEKDKEHKRIQKQDREREAKLAKEQLEQREKAEQYRLALEEAKRKRDQSEESAVKDKETKKKSKSSKRARIEKPVLPDPRCPLSHLHINSRAGPCNLTRLLSLSSIGYTPARSGLKLHSDEWMLPHSIAAAHLEEYKPHFSSQFLQIHPQYQHDPSFAYLAVAAGNQPSSCIFRLNSPPDSSPYSLSAMLTCVSTNIAPMSSPTVVSKWCPHPNHPLVVARAFMGHSSQPGSVEIDDSLPELLRQSSTSRFSRTSTFQLRKKSVWTCEWTPTSAVTPIRIAIGASKQLVLIDPMTARSGPSLISKYNGPSDVFSLCFDRSGHTITAGQRDGSISSVDTRIAPVHAPPASGPPKPLGTVLAKHSSGVGSMKRLSDDFRLISSSMDGSIRLWDLRFSKSPVLNYEGVFNQRTVLHLGINNSETLIASGSQDGSCFVWNVQNGRVVWQADSSYLFGISPMQAQRSWSEASSSASSAIVAEMPVVKPYTVTSVEFLSMDSRKTSLLLGTDKRSILRISKKEDEK